MAGSKHPIGDQVHNPVNVVDGTSCIQPSPLPGPLGLSIASNDAFAVAQSSPRVGGSLVRPPSTITVPTLMVRPNKASPAGLDFIKRCEGRNGQPQLLPYSDQTGQVQTRWDSTATIGYGHNITAREWPLYANGITAQRAEIVFAADVHLKSEDPLNACILVPLTQYQYDALVCLTFNIGGSAIRSSLLLQIINQPRLVGQDATDVLEQQWTSSFITSHHKVMAGLVKRRKAEWKLFSQGVYSTNIY